MKSNNKALLLWFLLGVLQSCNNSGEKVTDPTDTITNIQDTGKKYYVIDSTDQSEPVITGKEIEEFKRVKNLLEFHTKDSMKTGSTYIATLAMGKDISPKEMEVKFKAITEPGGKVPGPDPIRPGFDRFGPAGQARPRHRPG